ncbi:fumarylacetoacetase [Rhinocladiella mackenziei CBS 650.93]|uniref:Fumarylacetoacetase n=1 Tax=Rhinocladiella mackenziei CBS 650.93 TaxID=1442369 RepID=A0A0D2IPN9_9EURO|nr:fumarylacetoacetase [Rhinocladiella mackenziei CBS 650.93]KIX05121.1 fumarylacetoacetase [Rhinocladiella mackenziei CBS 650.93]
MAASSWITVPQGCPFTLANIPFGIITTLQNNSRRPAIAIGDFALDLSTFAAQRGFDGLSAVNKDNIVVFFQPTLNDFAALGRPFHRQVRAYLQELLSENTKLPEVLRDNDELREKAFISMKDIEMHLPMEVRGYTDFFAGKNHAFNCGCIFRDPKNALQPNYLHLPVGYSSRASSVVVSGTPIRRPLGQYLEKQELKVPVLGPCRRLDIELELGAFLCRSNPMGEPIDVDEAEDYIFGLVLLNDWSARDIQQWEAVPLGPFNAKNFGTSVSAWVVLTDALSPFRTPGMANETTLLPHLRQSRTDNVFDINLEVELTPASGEPAILSRTNGKNLIFSYAQMLAHHTIGGCPMEVGDLIGSGTISGAQPGTLGSLLEASNGGKQSFALSNSLHRTFLEDGDTVTIRGWCGSDPTTMIGFGECSGRIEPSPKTRWLHS